MSVKYNESRLLEQKKIDYILKNRQSEIDEKYYIPLYYQDLCVEINKYNNTKTTNI